jgi:hypothetical protein
MYVIGKLNQTHMFLFKMHSIGSVRPVPRAAAVANANMWGKPPPTQKPEQGPTHPQNLDEDVVVIQEEEMVLVRTDLNQEPEQQPEQKPEQQPDLNQEPQKAAAEAPLPSKSKPKKKQQRRK